MDSQIHQRRQGTIRKGDRFLRGASRLSRVRSNRFRGSTAAAVKCVKYSGKVVRAV